MRILSLVIFFIVIGCQVFCITPYVYSKDFNYEFTGVIYEQPSYFAIKNDSLVNPDNEILELTEWLNRFYGRISCNLYYKKAKFISQFRPTIRSEEGYSDFTFITDDAYLDVGIGEASFLYVGKRNIRDVVAYGANPTDFLGEDKAVDYTKREEERRIEREGNYLIGLDTFFKNLSLSAIYAPDINYWQEVKDRVLLRGSYFAEPINTDMTLHLFNGDIPGIGFDISSTLSDNLVLYTENAFRWGSKKVEIRIVNEGSDTVPRQYEITDPDDDSSVYPNIVVGGSYTFGNGTNFIAEYFYNGDGYDSSEWTDLTDYVKYNNDAYRNNFFPGLASGNLSQASGILKFREMRQNYIFIRLSNSKILENLDAQLAYMLNLDDSSFLIFPSIDYKVTKGLFAGLSSTMFFGDDDSEFGMTYWDFDISLIFKYYF